MMNILNLHLNWKYNMFRDGADDAGASSCWHWTWFWWYVCGGCVRINQRNIILNINRHLFCLLLNLVSHLITQILKATYKFFLLAFLHSLLVSTTSTQVVITGVAIIPKSSESKYLIWKQLNLNCYLFFPLFFIFCPCSFVAHNPTSELHRNFALAPDVGAGQSLILPPQVVQSTEGWGG